MIKHVFILIVVLTVSCFIGKGTPSKEGDKSDNVSCGVG